MSDQPENRIYELEKRVSNLETQLATLAVQNMHILNALLEQSEYIQYSPRMNSTGELGFRKVVRSAFDAIYKIASDVLTNGN